MHLSGLAHMNQKKIQVHKRLKGQRCGENFSKSTGTLGNITVGCTFDLFSHLLILRVLESGQPEIFISPPQEVTTQKKKIVYGGVCRSGKAVSSAKSETSLGYGLILKVKPLHVVDDVLLFIVDDILLFIVDDMLLPVIRSQVTC